MKSFKTMVCGIAMAALLSACGSTGGSEASGDAKISAQAISAGGIWTGKDGNNGLPVEIVVSESGDFTVSEANGVIYVGKLTMSGSSFDGTFQAYTTEITTPFFDGSTHATGSISGSVQSQAVFKAQIVLTTDLGADSSDVIQLTFDPGYIAQSSLTAIAGNYTDESSGTVYSIDANGTIFGQSAVTGCVLNGKILVVDADYSVYSVSSTVANCTGNYAALNGTFSGTATLDSSTSPSLLTMVSGDSQAKTGMILTLTGN